MKKKIAAFMAAGMLMTVTSCARAPEESSTESQTETTVTTTAQSEETAPETQTQFSSDVHSQMEIIVRNYDYICSDFYIFTEAYPSAVFAVTDLNHNGRLEIIVSSIQGSGAFSKTNFYEISEDYSTLEKLKIDGVDESDDAGDFLEYINSENLVSLYDCYLKNGEYYYLLKDYASAGWDYKYQMYYSYSFGNGVTRNIMGGCALSAEYEDGIAVVKTRLYGPANTLFESDEAYMEHMDSFWSEYERQDPCEVKWMVFVDGMNFAGAVDESYNAFNPHSELESSVTYDYHYYFDSVYGDDAEYVIVE